MQPLEDVLKATIADVVVPHGDAPHPLFFPSSGAIRTRLPNELDREAEGRDLHFTPRTLIFLEGDVAHSLYQITRGAVMLYKLLPDGRRQVVEVLGIGDVFGFSPSRVYDCSAETLVASSCAAFDRAMVEQSPVLMRKLSAHLYLQLSALHEHVMLLGRKSAMERITSFLTRCIPGRGGPTCPGPRERDDSAQIHLAMTRQEIADYLGLTIETVSRTMTLLENEDTIELPSARRVVVRSQRRLQQLNA